MSLFTYNNVQLPLPNMVKFDRTAVYEDSKTDWYCTRFDIRLQCCLNVAYLQVAVQAGGIPLQSPAQIMNALWTLLMTPRMQLSYRVQNIEMIPATQGGNIGTVDAMNGPQPQFCNIYQLTPQTFMLDYGVTAHYWQNNASLGTNYNGTGNNVLYNRWTERVVMDEMMRSTRIRQGIFRIRSDNTGGIVPDDIRSQMAVVSIPYNFKRMSSEYQVSMDGLTLTYKIIDQEVFKMPPKPAFKAEGWFLELATKPGAIYREGIVNVRLYGAPNTDQGDLYFAAVTIVSAKMAINLGAPIAGVYDSPFSDGPSTPAYALPVDPLYTEVKRQIWLYENIVEIEARAILNMSKKRIVSVPIGQGPMTFTPLTDDQATIVPPAYRDYGSAGLLLRAASYWDPNAVNNTTMGQGREASDSSPLTPFTPGSAIGFIGGGAFRIAPRIDLPGKFPGTTGPGTTPAPAPQ